MSKINKRTQAEERLRLVVDASPAGMLMVNCPDVVQVEQDWLVDFLASIREQLV